MTNNCQASQRTWYQLGANSDTPNDGPTWTMGSNKLPSSGPRSGIKLLFAYNLHMSTEHVSSLLDHFHGKIVLLRPWRWAFRDLFHSLFLLTSPYNRPRRYFMPEMNHRTKGDHMPRNSINDPPITGGGGEGSSYFMFKLLSPTSGSNQPWGWKVQCKSKTEHFKKPIWFCYNQ